MKGTYNSGFHYIFRLALLALAYAVTAKIILNYFAANHVVSIIWPPSGIALAALMLGGNKYWPGICIGAVIGNTLGGAGAPLFVNLGIGVGNSLEALTAFWLLTHYRQTGIDWDYPRDYLNLAIIGSLCSLISAAIGVSMLYLANIVSADMFLPSFIRWWQGDILGIIIICPLITLFTKVTERVLSKELYLHIIFCFGLAFLLGQAIFLGWFDQLLAVYAKPFWMFLFVTWVAVAFGKRGVLLLVCMVMIQALSGIFSGVELPYYPDLSTVEIKLKSLWIYLIALTIVGMAPALIINARRRIEQDLQESEERWKFALEGSGDGVWDWDITSHKVLLSAYFMRMYGHDGESIEASPEAWSVLVHPDDMEQVLADFDEHLSGKSPYYHNEHRVRCSDGTYKWILDRGMVVRHDAKGAPLRMVGTHSDISDRKHAEAQLLEVNANLEARVIARTKELESAKEVAESATKAKTEFLANMSHEIRTPISSMLGMSHLVLSTDLNEKQRDYIEKIQLSGKQLLALVDDVLDFSKLDAGKMVLEKTDFNIDAVVESIQTLFSQPAANKGLEIIFDVDSRIDKNLHGDSLRLGQILINYVSNAIKFSSQGKITVRVFAIASSNIDCLLRFEVKDQGIGIAADMRKKLFASFQQADMSIRRKYGGTGLGLAICRRLAEIMGGEVGFDSQPGKGSLFWFTARLARSSVLATDHALANGEAEQVVQDSSGNGSSLRGARILLAEDNLFNQQVTRELLELSGALVSVANNGQEALKHLKEGKYDCVLMDIQMPVMDGLEATRAIRAAPELRDNLVIAMTANAWSEDRERCLAVGMNDFLSKPVRPAQMITILDEWLACNTQTPVDMHVLSALYNGDIDKIRDIAAKFILFSSADIKNLRRALHAGDFAAIKVLGHKMQSGARQLGAMRFADICELLEKQPGPDALLRMYPRIQQLEKLLAQIAQQLQLNG